MAKAKNKARITVEITDADRAEVERLRQKLGGISESALTRLLLHHGVKHAPDALKEALEE